MFFGQEQLGRRSGSGHITVQYLFSENRAFYQTVEKYFTAVQAKVDNIIQGMHFACWLNKAADTHSEYVILPWQNWLRQRVTMLRLCVHCLVLFIYATVVQQSGN